MQPDLTSANLRGADLSGMDLAGASLSLANLKKADLGGATLIGANLAGANLEDANLAGANLDGAILAGTHLVRAVLAGAYLRKTNLAGANLTGRINLSGADLSDANLAGARLVGAILSGANLTRAILAGADLREADLTGANLTDAVVSGAKFDGADLAGAIVRTHRAPPPPIENSAQAEVPSDWEGAVAPFTVPAQNGSNPNLAAMMADNEPELPLGNEVADDGDTFSPSIDELGIDDLGIEDHADAAGFGEGAVADDALAEASFTPDEDLETDLEPAPGVQADGALDTASLSAATDEEAAAEEVVDEEVAADEIDVVAAPAAPPAGGLTLQVKVGSIIKGRPAAAANAGQLAPLDIAPPSEAVDNRVLTYETKEMAILALYSTQVGSRTPDQKKLLVDLLTQYNKNVFHGDVRVPMVAAGNAIIAGFDSPTNALRCGTIYIDMLREMNVESYVAVNWGKATAMIDEDGEVHDELIVNSISPTARLMPVAARGEVLILEELYSHQLTQRELFTFEQVTRTWKTMADPTGTGVEVPCYCVRRAAP